MNWPLWAPDFVRRKPDVIVSPGGVSTVRLLMQATSTIPIVMVTAQDAVENGLVSSLARPGGHVTGLSTQGRDLITKRLQLLQEALPPIRRVALFFDRTTPDGDPSAAMSAARYLGLEVRQAELSKLGEFDGAFAVAVDWGAEALLASGATIIFNRHQFAALAAKYRLPAMYHPNAAVHAGGLSLTARISPICGGAAQALSIRF